MSCRSSFGLFACCVFCLFRPARRAIQVLPKRPMLPEARWDIPSTILQSVKSNPPPKRSVLSGTKPQIAKTTSSIVDGQGAIKVSRHMLAACETVDEVAFILAHEAGHQIADHHGPQLGFNASDTGFTLRSLNPKRLELEADVIAVILSDRAGFAPEAGMTAIRRFGGVFGVETKTHPDPQRRIDLVQRTIELIRAGHTITF